VLVHGRGGAVTDFYHMLIVGMWTLLRWLI